MSDAKTAGRVIGALLLLQMAGSYLVNFTLLAPLSAAPGGLLASAATDPLRVGVWGLLGLVVAAMPLGIGIAAWPPLRRVGERWALWVIALGAVSLALQVVEHIGLLAVWSLSEARLGAGSAAQAPYDTVALLARSLRNWTHFSALVVSGALYLGFFSALWVGGLVPRVLSGLGVLATVLQMTAVALPFLGRDVYFPLLAPIGVVHLLLALWLLWRGLGTATRESAG